MFDLKMYVFATTTIVTMICLPLPKNLTLRLVANVFKKNISIVSLEFMIKLDWINEETLLSKFSS